MSSLKWLSGWDPSLLSRLDRLDVITPMPDAPFEDIAADARAETTEPKGGQR